MNSDFTDQRHALELQQLREAQQEAARVMFDLAVYKSKRDGSWDRFRDLLALNDQLRYEGGLP